MQTTALTIFLYLWMLPLAHSELIQILHTNDIHSHLEQAIHKPDLGGYGRLKNLIEKEKNKAAAEGIGSLVLDAGDFLEGNIYYLASNGRKTFNVIDSVGYDAVALGNHDYLMGLADLDNLLGQVPVSFNFLCANLQADAKLKNINKKILPYMEKTINGVKVGIIGVTGNDILYKWRLGDGTLKNETETVRQWAKVLRERGNNLIIALTHIGLPQDMLLAFNVSEIDLIVGGHSHNALHDVMWVHSKEGKSIPIVQAGKHAEWLGKLRVDYNHQEQKLKIASYELLPVNEIPGDQKIDELVKAANIDLDNLFGSGWLSEIVGQSKLRPQHQGGNEDIWMYFINDAMMDTVKSDIAIHVGPLSGNNYPITGPITRRDLYNSNPRQFEFENIKGYSIYTARVRGFWIKLTMKVVMSLGLPLYFSGITFDYTTKKQKYNIDKIRIQGEKIKLFKPYKVTISEAIVRASQAISPWFKVVLSFPQNWKIPMIKALESRMRNIGTITEDYRPNEFRMRAPDHHGL
ncbi:MAG: hypothetical protein A2X86_14360 [Bdellovibrionales bacterium GWA2_49_15]|nr:MAG: hypothetical protein A2X86_14360 [Bdellovibrionales bacterium GWA2_49_15]